MYVGSQCKHQLMSVALLVCKLKSLNPLLCFWLCASRLAVTATSRSPAETTHSSQPEQSHDQEKAARCWRKSQHHVGVFLSLALWRPTSRLGFSRINTSQEASCQSHRWQLICSFVEALVKLFTISFQYRMCFVFLCAYKTTALIIVKPF